MSHFVPLGKPDHFPPRKMRAFKLGDREIVVVRADGGLYAFENRCTHQQELLTDGFLIDRTIVCGYHEATYALDSGAPIAGPALDPLPVFSVRIEADVVVVEWPEVVDSDAVVAVNHDDDERFYDKM